MTWKHRPAVYEPSSDEAPALLPYDGPSTEFAIPRTSTISDNGHRLIYFVQAKWHRVWERQPLKFSIWVAVAVIVASLFEVLPTFLIKSNIPTIASVKPYTPLELVGRDVYVAEGCYNCHSQMIRPIRSETERYGEYSKPGEFVYDHPFQWGSRRIGPDLQREGGKYPYLWHVRHMQNPRSTTPQSIMPAYGWLFENDLDYGGVQPRVDAMAMLGVPYGEAVLHAESMARAQGKQISAEILAQGGPAGLERKQIIALIAYLQRLGTDIKRLPPQSAPGADPRARVAEPNAAIHTDVTPVRIRPEAL